MKKAFIRTVKEESLLTLDLRLKKKLIILF